MLTLMHAHDGVSSEELVDTKGLAIEILAPMGLLDEVSFTHTCL